MREVTERAYFSLSLALGWLLRSSRYSKVRIVRRDGELQVHKHRVFYAPVLVWLSGPLIRVLDTGVRVLPQREWENREREIYQRLHRASIQIDPDGTVILPWLPGETLATILQDPSRAESVRTRAIELSVVALAEFHRRGLTHGDAMAENVMVDLDGGAAHWFDYETIHQSGRPMAWRRADDVRALLVTCILRTAPARVAEILRFILDVYADDGVAGVLVENFGSALRRPLAFHLAQAPLSFRCFRQIAQVLRQRLHGPGTFSQHTSLTKSS